jgi:acetylglutamate kinase
VSRVVVKLGGRVAESLAAQTLELADEGHEVCVVHGAGPQISLEMERAGVPVRFVGGRRFTTEDGLEIVRRSFGAVNAALCASIGDRAVPLDGDQAGLTVEQVPELGLVAEVRTTPLPALAQLLESGRIPVVAPVTKEFNVNADDAAAAIAIGVEADRLLFLTDVEGFLLGGEVVDSLDVPEAERLFSGGELDPTILPKLGAAITAARGGVPAYIGRTEVPAR